MGNDKKKRLIASVARSMEAEGFDFKVVKRILEKKIQLDRDSFVKEITDLATELNALHPFREGNGRAIRLFLIMLADDAGYLLDYSQVSADTLIKADNLAFEGDVRPLLSL